MISEGDEIFSGDPVSPNQNHAGNEDVSGNGEIYAETYIGIQNADPTTELLENMVTLLIAFSVSFVGGKVRSKKS